MIPGNPITSKSTHKNLFFRVHFQCKAFFCADAILDVRLETRASSAVFLVILSFRLVYGDDAEEGVRNYDNLFHATSDGERSRSGKRADPGYFDPVHLAMMPAERKRFKSIT